MPIFSNWRDKMFYVNDPVGGKHFSTDWSITFFPENIKKVF